MTLVLAALLGYAVGSLSPATLLARARGVDLRLVGSGNPGAANAGRALGRRAGLAVGAADVAKGLLPALVAALLLGAAAGHVAGLAAVLGHVSSPLLRGHGGKGVATAFGAALAVHPVWAVGALATWLGVLAATRWIALASVCAVLALPVMALLLEQARLWAVALFAVVVVRHRGNFVGQSRP